jgi:hypothetical protein
MGTAQEHGRGRQPRSQMIDRAGPGCAWQQAQASSVCRMLRFIRQDRFRPVHQGESLRTGASVRPCFMGVSLVMSSEARRSRDIGHRKQHTSRSRPDPSTGLPRAQSSGLGVTTGGMPTRYGRRRSGRRRGRSGQTQSHLTAQSCLSLRAKRSNLPRWKLRLLRRRAPRNDMHGIHQMTLRLPCVKDFLLINDYQLSFILYQFPGMRLRC